MLAERACWVYYVWVVSGEVLGLVVNVYDSHVDQFLLSEEQKQFLIKLVALSRYVRDQVIKEREFEEDFIKTEVGIFPSIITAMCIMMSRWGTSILAQERVYETVHPEKKRKAWLPGNNLLNMRADAYHCKYMDTIELNGRLFKSFNDWCEFGTELINIFVWKGNYDDVVTAGSAEAQLLLLAKRKKRPREFHDGVSRVIKSYQLQDLDQW